MKLIHKLFLSILFMYITGCGFDARFSKIKQLGNSQEVTCYSGGKIIYHGFSTGKVVAEEGGGHFFTEKGTGDLIEILGNCIIRSAK